MSWPPKFPDGAEYRVAHRVALDARPSVEGSICWVEWRDPGGKWMQERNRSNGKPKPGAWWAVVSWDDQGPDRPHARLPLEELVPLPMP